MIISCLSTTTKKRTCVHIGSQKLWKKMMTRIFRVATLLLMPQPFASPGHQRPCYWIICRMNFSLSSTWRNIKFLYHPVMRNNRKWKYFLCFLEYIQRNKRKYLQVLLTGTHLCQWCQIAEITIPNHLVNSSPPGQNGCHCAHDIFKRIFLNENIRISNHTSLKFVANGPIDNKSALVQVMAWRRTGDKPLPEPMLT